MPDGWHVSAKDIIHWAENSPRQAQENLPLLIQKLIFSSVKPSHLHLPVGDSILNKGWDGIVDVEEGNAFVPIGKSVWELSTQEDAENKANNDYEKRTNNPLLELIRKPLHL